MGRHLSWPAEGQDLVYAGKVDHGFDKTSAAELRRRLGDLPLVRYTASTITGPEALVARILADHAQGYSIVDEELERGLRSMSVPIVSRSGRNVAALNLSALSNRTTPKEMRERFLPELRAVAEEISASLA